LGPGLGKAPEEGKKARWKQIVGPAFGQNIQKERDFFDITYFKSHLRGNHALSKIKTLSRPQ
jgi:hypothetical protein